mgnify:CR=1 FL=1
MKKHALLIALIVVNVTTITHHAIAQTKSKSKTTQSRVVFDVIYIDRIDVSNVSNACNDRAFEIVTRRANDAKCVAIK